MQSGVMLADVLSDKNFLTASRKDLSLCTREVAIMKTQQGIPAEDGRYPVKKFLSRLSA
jgi:hypothetical protein